MDACQDAGSFETIAAFQQEDDVNAISASNEIFGSFNSIPPEPKKGRLTTTSREHTKEIMDKLKLEISSPFWAQKYEKLIADYSDVFSSSKFDLGHAEVLEHSIRLKDPQEISHVNQFRIPLAHQKLIQEYAQKLSHHGVIEESNSPFNSPIFCVPKTPL